MTRRSALTGFVTPVLVLLAWGALGTWSLLEHLYFHGPPYAEGALSWSTPNSGDVRDRTLGYLEFTAERMQELQPGRRWGPIDYVDADVASTRPDMVSVNPIDRRTWGAAAYSLRTQRCYLKLITNDPGAYRTLYGWLEPGQACVGSAATRTSVTSTQAPPE